MQSVPQRGSVWLTVANRLLLTVQADHALPLWY